MLIAMHKQCSIKARGRRGPWPCSLHRGQRQSSHLYLRSAAHTAHDTRADFYFIHTDRMSDYRYSSTVVYISRYDLYLHLGLHEIVQSTLYRSIRSDPTQRGHGACCMVRLPTSGARARPTGAAACRAGVRGTSSRALIGFNFWVG
jgi:hypothetical protein